MAEQGLRAISTTALSYFKDEELHIENVGKCIGYSLYADDGAIWKRGNILDI